MLGYWGQPEKTAESLVRNTLQTAFDERFYRTGDLVKRDGRGDYWFVGRRDNMVKSRGYRIELGEIESALNLHPSVKNAVILTQKNDDGDRRLIAYLISEPECDLNIAELRDYLYSKLPRYMVPNLYAVLDEFPLTTSGKINRKALLEVDGIQTGFEENYLRLALAYAVIGDREKTYENLRMYYETGHTSINVFNCRNEPMFETFREDPEFDQIMNNLENIYQAEHERVRQWLEENDML